MRVWVGVRVGVGGVWDVIVGGGDGGSERRAGSELGQ